MKRNVLLLALCLASPAVMAGEPPHREGTGGGPKDKPRPSDYHCVKDGREVAVRFEKDCAPAGGQWVLKSADPTETPPAQGGGAGRGGGTKAQQN